MHRFMSTGRHLTKLGLIIMALALFTVACEEWEFEQTQQYTKVEQQSFAVGDTPTLTVDNFGGSISVRTGEEGTVRVVATRRAAVEEDLDRIQVAMTESPGAGTESLEAGTESPGGLRIETDKPRRLNNVSVQLEITAPENTVLDLRTGGGSVDVSGFDNRVDVHTGGGSVEIDDTSGDVYAQTGGGSIKIRGASGQVFAQTGGGSITIRDASGEVFAKTGGGSIDYQGRPQGDCRLTTGGGSIDLRLPRDTNARVDLETGAGKVDVDFSVDGYVSRSRISGTIGHGDGSRIEAHTGAGDVDLHRQ